MKTGKISSFSQPLSYQLIKQDKPVLLITKAIPFFRSQGGFALVTVTFYGSNIFLKFFISRISACYHYFL